MLRNAGSSSLSLKISRTLVSIILLGGVIGLVNIVNPISNLVYAISNPISSPVSPTPSPISGPINPSLTPSPSVSPSPTPRISPSPSPTPVGIQCPSGYVPVIVNSTLVCVSINQPYPSSSISPTPSPSPRVYPSPTPSPFTLPKIKGFTLVNADNDKDISKFSNIKDYSIIKLSKLPTKNINIRANYNSKTIGKVKFSVTVNPFFGYTKTSYNSSDYSAPYALFGDNGKGDYYSYTLKPYTFYSVSATPFYNIFDYSSGNSASVNFFVLP